MTILTSITSECDRCHKQHRHQMAEHDFQTYARTGTPLPAAWFRFNFPIGRTGMVLLCEDCRTALKIWIEGGADG